MAYYTEIFFSGENKTNDDAYLLGYRSSHDLLPAVMQIQALQTERRQFCVEQNAECYLLFGDGGGQISIRCDYRESPFVVKVGLQLKTSE